MKTRPVLQCKRCGRYYTFNLKTQVPDPEGVLLHKFMDEILKDGICDICFERRAWYAGQGRIADWEAGRP